MDKKQLIIVWIVGIIILLAVIIFQLNNISSKLDNIDWTVRNIIGKM